MDIRATLILILVIILIGTGPQWGFESSPGFHARVAQG